MDSMHIDKAIVIYYNPKAYEITGSPYFEPLDTVSEVFQLNLLSRNHFNESVESYLTYCLLYQKKKHTIQFPVYSLAHRAPYLLTFLH